MENSGDTGKSDSRKRKETSDRKKELGAGGASQKQGFFTSLSRLFFPSSTEKVNDPCLINQFLPKDILSEILMRVDTKCLLLSAARTCRLWNDILSNSDFWLQKCLFENCALPPKHIRAANQFDYAKICLKNPYERNLIKNPSGEEGMKRWKIVQNGGDQFKVERPPVGADANVEVCFATSHGLCIKQQIVDLEKEGIEGWILDELKPTITVSEWHAARFDCGASYDIEVKLQPSRGRGPALVSFQRKVVTEQWLGRQWSEISHAFSDYPRGVRFVHFKSGGKDTQFWAGHYGPKLSRASVKISF